MLPVEVRIVPTYEVVANLNLMTVKIPTKTSKISDCAALDPRSWLSNPLENTLYTSIVVDCSGPPEVIVCITPKVSKKA